MRISCPYCGERDSAEFQQRGDAKPVRPASGESIEAFADYTYVRNNPAGRLEELWYHTQGCKSWLTVVRDTRTHDIESVRFAQESGS